MPQYLAAKEVVDAFNDAQDQRKTKEDLYLVNSLKTSDIESSEICWFQRNPVGGLSPLVSAMQNSPLVGQGTYRQYKAGAIRTRHAKMFTNEELLNLTSADNRFRINEKKHIMFELRDMERRIWETMEFVGNSALARGAVKYVSNDPANKIDVNVTFPGVVNENALATWTNIATDIPAHIDAAIKKFKNKFGKKPDKMVMTDDTWLLVKNNTAIKTLFSAYARTTGLNAKDIPQGVVTPEFVAKCGNWPPFEIRDQMTFAAFTTKNAEGEGSQTVELIEGTWGISVGDTVLCNYDLDGDSYDYAATVTAVTAGVSITFTVPSGGSLAANSLLVIRPTFFPQQIVQFIADENGSEFVRVPFGIEYTGSTIAAAAFKGPKFDIFEGGKEPNLVVYRRAWHEFGLVMGSKIINLKVVV